ncbi:MAG TPA: hypothetical protein VMU87_23270 [Stellaceae bacterium]|nr:hypothetical protein [Stellaceae bacterium]
MAKTEIVDILGERAVTTILMNAPLDCRPLHMLTAMSHHLEAAAAALLCASLKRRDHILGDVMLA